jgi:hypothetical protein
MKPIIACGLIITGLLYAQELKLNTQKGQCKIALNDQSDFKPGKGQLETSILIKNIVARLDHLEKICNQNLEKEDRILAISLLDDLYFLIGLFPDNYHVVVAPYLPTPQPPPLYPISEHDFGALRFRLKAEPFSDDQLGIVRTVAISNYFLVAQVEKILSVFSFEDDRLQVVRTLYPRILDDENAFRLYGSFEFSDSKEELAKILD